MPTGVRRAGVGSRKNALTFCEDEERKGAKVQELLGFPKNFDSFSGMAARRGFGLCTYRMPSKKGDKRYGIFSTPQNLLPRASSSASPTLSPSAAPTSTVPIVAPGPDGVIAQPPKRDDSMEKGAVVIGIGAAFAALTGIGALIYRRIKAGKPPAVVDPQSVINRETATVIAEASLVANQLRRSQPILHGVRPTVIAEISLIVATRAESARMAGRIPDMKAIALAVISERQVLNDRGINMLDTHLDLARPIGVIPDEYADRLIEAYSGIYGSMKEMVEFKDMDPLEFRQRAFMALVLWEDDTFRGVGGSGEVFIDKDREERIPSKGWLRRLGLPGSVDASRLSGDEMRFMIETGIIYRQINRLIRNDSDFQEQFAYYKVAARVASDSLAARARGEAYDLTENSIAMLKRKGLAHDLDQVQGAPEKASDEYSQRLQWYFENFLSRSRDFEEMEVWVLRDRVMNAVIMWEGMTINAQIKQGGTVVTGYIEPPQQWLRTRVAPLSRKKARVVVAAQPSTSGDPEALVRGAAEEMARTPLIGSPRSRRTLPETPAARGVARAIGPDGAPRVGKLPQPKR